jgi:hypothetical protein
MELVLKFLFSGNELEGATSLSDALHCYRRLSGEILGGDRPGYTVLPLQPAPPHSALLYHAHHSNRHPHFIHEPHTAVPLHLCAVAEREEKKIFKSALTWSFSLWCSGTQQAATCNFDHRRTLTHLGVNQVMLTTYYLERLKLVPDQKNPARADVLASSSYFGEPEISEFSTGLICVGSMHF